MHEQKLLAPPPLSEQVKKKGKPRPQSQNQQNRHQLAYTTWPTPAVTVKSQLRTNEIDGRKLALT